MENTNRLSLLVLVEDDTQRLSIQNILDQINHPVIFARDRQQCLAYARQEPPGLVIAWLHDLSTELHEQLLRIPEPPSILALVEGDMNHISSLLAVGVNDCLAEPIHPTLLLKRIENIMMVHQTKMKPQKVESNRRLVDSANDAMFITDLLTGQLLDVNQRAEKWLGYSREQFLEMTHEDIEVEAPNPYSDHTIIEEISTNGRFIFEQTYRTRDNRLLPAEVSSCVFRYEGRQAVLNFARDISKRKQFEETGRQQQRLADALRSTAISLASTLELDNVMSRIIEQVRAVVPCETADLMLVEEGLAAVTIDQGYDEIGIDRTQSVLVWDIHKIMPLRWMADNRQPIIITDIQATDSWLDLDHGPLHAYLGVPIVADDELIGFINVMHREPGRFDANHETTLMAFASQASIAIQNARLHETTRNHATALEARIVERTLELRHANLHLKEQIVERQQVEERLNAERNLLRTLIDNIPDAIYVKDTQGRYLVTNRAYRQFTAQPDQAADLWAEDKSVIDSKQAIINQEKTLESPDSSKIYLLTTKVPILDSHERVVSIISIQHNVTALRQADEALKEERNLLRNLIDNIPSEIFVKNLEGQIILANRAFMRHFGQLAPNTGGIEASGLDYIPNNLLQEKAQKEFDDEIELMRTGHNRLNQERNYTMPNGQNLWFDIMRVPLQDSQQNIIGLVGINQDITQRKLDEQRLNHIVAGANCLLWYAIVEVPDNGPLIWEIYLTNEQAAQRFLPISIGPAQTFANAWAQSVLPEDRQRIDANAENALRNRATNYHQEFRCQQANGDIRWLHEEVQIQALTMGRYNLIGVCTDITDRKLAEESLQRNNELLEQRVEERTKAEQEQRILAEALSDSAAALIDSIELNEVLGRILSYVARVVPPHEAAGIMLIEDQIYVRSLRSFINAQITEHNERIFLESLPSLEQMYATRTPLIINNILETDWTTLPYMQGMRSYIGIPIQVKGNIIGFINLGSQQPNQFNDDHARRLSAFSNQAGIAIQNAQLFDSVRSHASDLEERVTERTHELELERRQLSTILNAMTEGVVFMDNEGQPRYINESMADLTGYDLQAWIDNDTYWPFTIISHEDQQQLIMDIMETTNRQRMWRGELLIEAQDGEPFDAQLVMTMVPNQDGYPIGTVTVIRDISAEKRLEQQKARFIATASHELRTPITNLKTRLYLISKQPEKLNDNLEVLTLVTDRMQKLVDDLLDVSRFEHNIIELKREPVEIQKLITDVVRIQEPEAVHKHIEIKADLPSDQIIIKADESRLSQVITNLITNAINYTPEGGTIRIAAIPTPQQIEINVQDTGIGIPSDLVSQVFQPFFRVSDYTSGMGLGLSITREIVALHGGQINVSSEQNVGTIFSITLPRQ